MTPRIAVVGGGMAAARFAERYGALGGPGEVTVYGAEPRAPYNRVLLTEVLTGRHDPESIALPLGGAGLRPGCEVLAIDLGGRTVKLADGSAEPWDELVLATGADPVLPPVRGLRRPDGHGLAEGVHTLRTLEDCVRLAEEAVEAERAVVIGGGVLGVSTARALAGIGVHTEIVQRGPYLIDRQLDAGAAAVLLGKLRALGVACHLGTRPVALHTGAGGRGRVRSVEPADGGRLDCDLVVLACGTRPSTALAEAAGLPVATGVLVDDDLAAAPHVHAIGDCAEHRGTVYGLAGPAWEQADVLARRLSGAEPDARYPGSARRARLSAGGLDYVAFGAVDEGDGQGLDVLRLTDATRGSYKKLVLRGDRLVGAILLGDLATVDELAGAFADGGVPAGDPLHLLTRGTVMTGEA
ncbi:NAD(P)/FAD-dependent oxidoreductase [Kitasatospora sp. NPDC056651]|uniref:NAD(P)/FAD-dependent oxidoreductase n=1 Tax=Kitasatospora sp. NPDC056651 TaxID=3345892 RepID=UPI0036C24FDB